MSKIITISLAGIGAFLEGIGTVIEKKILKNKEIDSKSYTLFEFIAIVLAAIPIFLLLNTFFPNIFSWTINSQALSMKNLFIMFGIILFGTLANFLVFYAMKWQKLTSIEPIRLTQPLFVILLAFILYSSERSLPIHIIIAAIIASLALVLSHIRKHHLQFNKYAMAALLGSLFFAVDLVLSKFLLPYYSPLSLYIVRSIAILIICFIFVKPNYKRIKKSTYGWIFITGIIWVLYRGILYYSYTLKGIIFTTLLFLLTPIFIYLFSYFYLGEKPTWRNIIAAIIIVLCIAYVMIVNGF